MMIRYKEIKPIEFDKLKKIDYTSGQNNNPSFAKITVPIDVSHKL